MMRRMSAHGIARFIERVGYVSRKEMMFIATFGRPGFTFKWEPDKEQKGYLVLLTVIKTGHSRG